MSSTIEYTQFCSSNDFCSRQLKYLVTRQKRKTRIMAMIMITATATPVYIINLIILGQITIRRHQSIFSQSNTLQIKSSSQYKKEVPLQIRLGKIITSEMYFNSSLIINIIYFINQVFYRHFINFCLQFLMWSWLCCRDRQKQQQQRLSRKVPIQKINKKAKKISHKSDEHTDQKIQNAQSITTKQPAEQVIEKTDVYVGQEMNGVPHGNGTKHYVNGDYYKGEWINGQKQGKGEQYYFQLNTTYNGQWKHDMKNGKGHQTEPNGSWYQGQFKDGLRDGKGIYYDKYINAKYTQVYVKGNLHERKQIVMNEPKMQDQFPTLKLDKQRFNSSDLVGFQQKNPQIKELDLQFLLKYYGLKKIICLEFIDIPVVQWTIKHILSFLEQINLKQYKSVFFDNKIKGKDLAELTQKQMKQDLNMKLGDRKILKSYIQYLLSMSKNKKKQSSDKQKQQNRDKFAKRRQSLSVKKKKQSLLNSITKSIEHQIIEQDQQWNEGNSEEDLKDKKQRQSLFQKRKNQYQTQNWDKYASKDIMNSLNYHSQVEMPNAQNDKTSDKTQKGSNQQHDDQIDQSQSRYKKNQDAKQVAGVNSLGANSNNYINATQKKQKQSSSSQINSQVSEQEGQVLKIKRKKTSLASGPSQEIRQLYQFLKQNQSLDFIIKQKDIQIIEQTIGEGGYGKVSRGKYMQYPVAVKDYMKAGRSHKSRQQFMKEVHILSDLKHPNIVLYMGLCITVNRYQLVTEFMQNGSLYDQLHKKKTKFTKQQQLQMIDDIVQGMVYLHSMKKMLHRDLKSSNVLIAEDYKVKLCDFGLSGHKNKNKKQKKNRIGTYQWMAPEVIRNQELDFFSDVYSFGVILWEILTEKVPYDGLSQPQIIGQVGYDKNHRLPPPPKGSDQFIIRIMDKCLNRDPTERPTFIQIQQFIKEERKNRPPAIDVWNIL